MGSLSGHLDYPFFVLKKCKKALDILDLSAIILIRIEAMQCITEYRGVEQLVARRAHNPEVASSSLVPATTKRNHPIWVVFFLCCELCSRLRPTGSRSTTAKRSRWEIQRRLLWRSGQNLSALQAVINFGHRKSASRGVASVRHYKSF